MDFVDELRRLSERAKNLANHVKTEEATKHSLVLPFIQLLGYDVFDPSEIVPEFTADVGTKKGEKVDYAIIVNGKPAVLIEAKNVTDNLLGHDSQLFRYFTTTEAKFAVLTNGVIYKFFSDLNETNKMDDVPFLEFDLMDLNDVAVAEIKKFHKQTFNADSLFIGASNLKYTSQIRATMDAELQEPSDEFMRFLLREVYSGKVTTNVLERFRPVVKRALLQYINDLISDKFKSAMQSTVTPETEIIAIVGAPPDVEADKPKPVTTQEELEAFYLVKSMLRDVIDPSRLQYKDTTSYFAVLIDGNVRKWLCRFYFNSPRKRIAVQGDDKSEVFYDVPAIDDLFNQRKELIGTATRLASPAKE